MYIVAVALFELWFFTCYVHIYITLGVFIVYAFWYWDGKEYTGERHWTLFRTLRVWKRLSPVEYAFAPNADIQSTKGKRLFIFVPCSTPLALIWGIGLHGNQIEFKNRMHYIVPPCYMWVPFVRDVLLWTGAVTYSTLNATHSMHEIIRGMLIDGRSICYAPSNFNNTIDDLEIQISTRYPPLELLTFCIDEKIQLVPVVVQGEHERYRIIEHDLLKRVQSWFYKKIDYRMPLVYWMRLFAKPPPPPLTLSFGSPMDCQLYSGGEMLNSELRRTVTNMTVPALHDKRIKPQ